MPRGKDGGRFAMSFVAAPFTPQGRGNPWRVLGEEALPAAKLLLALAGDALRLASLPRSLRALRLVPAADLLALPKERFQHRTELRRNAIGNLLHAPRFCGTNTGRPCVAEPVRRGQKIRGVEEEDHG